MYKKTPLKVPYIALKEGVSVRVCVCVYSYIVIISINIDITNSLIDIVISICVLLGESIFICLIDSFVYVSNHYIAYYIVYMLHGLIVVVS